MRVPLRLGLLPSNTGLFFKASKTARQFLSAAKAETFLHMCMVLADQGHELTANDLEWHHARLQPLRVVEDPDA